MKKLQNIDTNGKYICQRWNRLAFHFKPINIVYLVEETYEDKEEGGRRGNNTRGRNRRLA
jgi:hypothetical protein